MISYLDSLRNVLKMINNGRSIHLRNNLLQIINFHICFIEKNGYVKDKDSLNRVIERTNGFIKEEMSGH